MPLMADVMAEPHCPATSVDAEDGCHLQVEDVALDLSPEARVRGEGTHDGGQPSSGLEQQR